MAEGDLILEVPVDRLLKICDPTKVTAWGWRISPDEIEEAVSEGRFRSEVWDPFKAIMGERRYHIERVAYFVVNGWLDPIDIDVGVPSLGCHVEWVVQDGNHRFYAAVIRGDQSILSMLSGDLNYAKDLFGVPIT